MEVTFSATPFTHPFPETTEDEKKNLLLPILFLFILHLLWPTEMTAVEAKLASFCTIPAAISCYVTFCYNSILDWIII